MTMRAVCQLAGLALALLVACQDVIVNQGDPSGMSEMPGAADSGVPPSATAPPAAQAPPDAAMNGAIDAGPADAARVDRGLSDAGTDAAEPAVDAGMPADPPEVVDAGPPPELQCIPYDRPQPKPCEGRCIGSCSGECPVIGDVCDGTCEGLCWGKCEICR